MNTEAVVSHVVQVSRQCLWTVLLHSGYTPCYDQVRSSDGLRFERCKERYEIHQAWLIDTIVQVPVGIQIQVPSTLDFLRYLVADRTSDHGHCHVGMGIQTFSMPIVTRIESRDHRKGQAHFVPGD